MCPSAVFVEEVNILVNKPSAQNLYFLCLGRNFDFCYTGPIFEVLTSFFSCYPIIAYILGWHHAVPSDPYFSALNPSNVRTEWPRRFEIYSNCKFCKQLTSEVGYGSKFFLYGLWDANKFGRVANFWLHFGMKNDLWRLSTTQRLRWQPRVEIQMPSRSAKACLYLTC